MTLRTAIEEFEPLAVQLPASGIVLAPAIRLIKDFPNYGSWEVSRFGNDLRDKFDGSVVVTMIFRGGAA